MTATITVGDSVVPRIGFGTLYLSVERGFGGARPDAIALLQEAADLGVRFFDTADSYGNGSAEDAVRQALYPYDGLLVTTKGGFRHERLGAWVPDARPDRLRAALEGSLRRLGVETIELYQLHCPDWRVPYAESVGALAALQREGKIRHIGVSNVGLAELEAARREAEIVSVQNPYNVDYPWACAEIEYCAADGIAFIAWMPLGDGGLSWGDSRLQTLARKYEATPAQVALGALLHRSPAILPIPGTSSRGHLRENVAARNLHFDDADLSLLWPDRL